MCVDNGNAISKKKPSLINCTRHPTQIRGCVLVPRTQLQTQGDTCQYWNANHTISQGFEPDITFQQKRLYNPPWVFFLKRIYFWLGESTGFRGQLEVIAFFDSCFFLWLYGNLAITSHENTPSKRLGLTFEARRKRNIKDSAHSTSPCMFSLYLTDNVGNCFNTCLTASSNLSRRCWRSLSAFWSWPLRKRSRKVTNKEEFWAQACDVTMHYSGTQRRRWLIIQLTAHYSFLRGKKHANHHKVSL